MLFKKLFDYNSSIEKERSNEMREVLFKHEREDWETPNWLFEELNEKYRFEYDLFANEANALCERYFSEENSAFENEWGRVNFANPPYSTAVQNRVFKRAWEEMAKGKTTVLLVPARTDTKRFHRYVFGVEGVSVRFLEGRLRFGDGKKDAPFPSCIIEFKGKERND